jgi:adenylylsulfate kinase
MGNSNFCLWITGLPGSGKSTITRELDELLMQEGVTTIVLAMDELRSFLTPEPTYTEQEREIVYRALVMMAQLLTEHSAKSVIIDATGNRRRFRELARQRIRQFAEVYIKCAVEVCKAREAGRQSGLVQQDLYGKAERGELPGSLPGVTAPYEAPANAELEVSSDALTPVESAEEIVRYVQTRWLNRK